MKRRTTKQHEMGLRAVLFLRAHPDDSAGGQAAVSRLEALSTEAAQLAKTATQGQLESRSATTRKWSLRRRIGLALLPHLGSAAKLAEAEVPGTAEKFAMPRTARGHAAYLSSARAIYDEAVANKELLVKYGLSDAILQALDQSLNDLATAIADSGLTQQAHVGANEKADAVAAEIVMVVNLLDALNRHRFAGDPQLLGEWESACNVVATPSRSPAETPAPTPAPAPSSAPAATPPANAEGGEVRPAA